MQLDLDFRAGQQVLAQDEAIGELVEIIVHDDVKYLHIRRYGQGHDDLYVPSLAVERVAPQHIYLDLPAAELLGQPWHQHPANPRTSNTLDRI